MSEATRVDGGEVTMPRLSDSMEEGTIVRWLAADGDQVKIGDELVEIETDKATMPYAAESAGTLQILAPEGAPIAVGTPIARIGGTSAAPTTAPAVAGSTAVDAAAKRNGTGRVRASPLARRLAAAHGVDLQVLNGSGPQGRIVKRDIEQLLVRPAGPGTQAGAPGGKGTVERRPLSSVQATIARRMLQAKATMPEFTLSTEVDVEAAIALRKQLAAIGEERAPSLGDFVIRACALALREHPNVNASFRGEAIEIYERVNIGVAVAAPGALFVPTVRDADTKTLGQISREVAELAGRARAGRLAPADSDGATFTVSNLGMHGITHFTAVLNPPQAAILALGAAQQRAVVHDGALTARHRMEMTLSCDHRAIYGADGASFLASVRGNLEEPLRLLI
ncbi:MAG: dihydrolipoamide acetyltransferase family protein [Solirubrobacteraceae bacterium]